MDMGDGDLLHLQDLEAEGAKADEGLVEGCGGD